MPAPAIMTTLTPSETISPSAAGSAAGLHRFAMLAAAMTFILIFVGGLVTSTGSGLAVPDWPLAFGRIIPPHWIGGIRFEYSHRVVAGVVSILTFALAAWCWYAEPRRWVRNLALGALGLVIVQALLGALNVVLELPLATTVAHAATAQIFFCLMVGLATFTNLRWEAMPRAEIVDDARPSLRTLTVITTTAIYTQILIGAVMRNLGAGLAIPDFPLNYGRVIPPGWSGPIAVNFAHRCGALAVTILIIWTFATVVRRYREEPRLMRLASGLLVLLALQVTLGALTIWTHRAVIPTTAHVAVGAAVLAASFALTLRTFRLAAPRSAAEATRARASYAHDHSITGSRVAS
jgi:cytochrome c oxidase assembly protein subunit 15